MGYYKNYGNKGYDGYSMSIRAREAYEDGEMPKSKWTKKAMLEVIKEYCEDYDVPYNEKIEKWKKDQIFDRYFEYRGWHHTSKMYNETPFFGLNENILGKDFFNELAETTIVTIPEQWTKDVPHLNIISIKPPNRMMVTDIYGRTYSVDCSSFYENKSCIAEHNEVKKTYDIMLRDIIDLHEYGRKAIYLLPQQFKKDLEKYQAENDKGMDICKASCISYEAEI